MKVHLYKKRIEFKAGFFTGTKTKMQCGFITSNFNIEKYETIDHTKITCEHCRKTQAFKDLEKSNNETKEILEDMEKIKNDTIKEFKESEPMLGIPEPKTYKQKIEIEIPVGWDFVRLGESKLNNFYLNDKGEVAQHVASGWFPYELKVIVKKKVKQGAELIGCLCGFSNTVLKEAEHRAIEAIRIGIPESIGLNGRYNNNSGGCYKYAYPVPAEKLDELKAKLMEV